MIAFETKSVEIDRWFDNAMDTRQVIEEFELDTAYDQFVGVGHSFGATSMYVVISIQVLLYVLTSILAGFYVNSFIPIHSVDCVLLSLSWQES